MCGVLLRISLWTCKETQASSSPGLLRRTSSLTPSSRRASQPRKHEPTRSAAASHASPYSPRRVTATRSCPALVDRNQKREISVKSSKAPLASVREKIYRHAPASRRQSLHDGEPHAKGIGAARPSAGGGHWRCGGAALALHAHTSELLGAIHIQGAQPWRATRRGSWRPTACDVPAPRLCAGAASGAGGRSPATMRSRCCTPLSPAPQGGHMVCVLQNATGTRVAAGMSGLAWVCRAAQQAPARQRSAPCAGAMRPG